MTRTQNQSTDQLHSAALAELTVERPGPCVSIYMPTDEQRGHAIPQEPLMLRRLNSMLAQQLATKGWSQVEIAEFLQPIDELAFPNQLFWSDQDSGLAIFLAPNFLKFYRLSEPYPPQARLGSHFWVRPLLPLITSDADFYLLTLSQNNVQLYRGTSSRLDPVPVPQMPKNLAETLRYDQFERSLQFHSSSSSSSVSSGRRAAIFHGQGAAGDERIKHQQLEQFLHEVEVGVTALLNGQHAPLFLAGVTYIQSIYRQHNHYDHLMSDNLPGNIDQATPTELHKACLPLFSTYTEGVKGAALARYAERIPGTQTVSGISEVIRAAQQQRVDTLFVASLTATSDRSPSTTRPMEIELWGRVNRLTGDVTLHRKPEPDDEELINYAVIHTLRHRGIVYPVMPEQIMGEVITATLRY